MAEIKKSESRFDSFLNVITGHGTARDKRTSSVPLYRLRTEEFYEQFFTANELARRIVEIVPKRALSKGWEFIGDEKEVNDKYKQHCEKIGLKQAVECAWLEARRFGGGLVYFVSKTGHPASPLDPNEEIVSVVPISRRDVRIFSSDVDSDFMSPNYARPELYFLNLQMGTQYKGYPIHWSRCVRFDGDNLPRQTFIRNNYWNDSVLNKLYNSIRNYESANDAVATLLQDANLGVYKMRNLANLIAEGQDEIVQRRLDMVEFSKSSINAMILDAEDEDYIDLTRNMSGIAEMLRQQSDRLVASTDIPHTVLLGESPDGSNATGNSTNETWDRYIKSEQQNYLRPKLNRAFEILFKKECSFKFPALSELTDEQRAELMAKQAQTDAIYIQNSVLTPEEVAHSRFGGDEYSIETEIDESIDRDELMSMEEIESNSTNPLTGTESFFNSEESDGRRDSLHEHGNYSRIHTFPREHGVDDETYFRHNSGNREPSLASGDDNPSPTVSENRAVETKTNKREPLISISQSLPFTDPNLEDITWLKGTEKKEYTPKTIGHETEKNKYDYQENPKYAQAVTIEIGQHDGSLLMGKRNDNGKITTPGGMVEQGESPRDAAARELFEETGHKIDPQQLELVSSNLTGHKKNMIVHHYKLDNVEKETLFTGANDPDREVSLWEWMTPDEIEKNLHHMQHPKSVILDKLGYYGKT